MDRRIYPMRSWQSPPSLAENFKSSSRVYLISISKAFKATNIAVKQEAQQDQQRSEKYARALEANSRLAIVPNWHFTEGDLKALDSLIHLRIPTESEDLTQLLKDLEDESCLPIWRAAIDSLISFQGASSGTVSWKSAKQRAVDILAQHDVAAENFERLQFVQNTPETERFCENIRAKLQLMRRFTVIYDAQPRPTGTEDRLELAEPRYELFPLGNQREKTVARAYPNVSPHINGPVLVTTVFLTTLISIIPLLVAWQHSTNDRGSATESDFWLLILNSMMCLVGIFCAIFPSFWYPLSAYNRWAQWLSVFGCLAAIAAIPMYLYLPTMWSALVAFLAQAIQGIVTLQLALATEQKP